MVEVSIIIPVYNVEKYLRQCLDSIVNQTFSNFEVICINDGSTDNSLAILNEYAQKDNRFMVISQENHGQGIARNVGIDLAKGEYIQFIDPDDWVELNMLEKLYHFAKQNNSKVVKFNYKDYNEYSGKLKLYDFAKHIKKEFNYDLNENTFYNWKILKKGCLTKLDLHVWAHFYKTDFIKNNHISFAPNKHGEDHLFADGAILLADKIDFLNEYLYYYRSRCGSAVNIKSNNNFCVFDNIQLLKQFILNHSLYEELKDEIQDYSRQVIRWHYDLIPQESIRRYESLCLQYFSSEKEFKKFIQEARTNRNFIENIFSLKNKRKGAIKYKVVTILGVEFKMKPKEKKEVLQ
ncbi:MAG: glycosyltransferase [Candidatus Gastranaerophilaceae bacterium]